MHGIMLSACVRYSPKCTIGICSTYHSQSYRIDAANFLHVVEKEEALNGKFAQGRMSHG